MIKNSSLILLLAMLGMGSHLRNAVNVPSALVPVVTFSRIPAQLQLYPRDYQDSAAVTISGIISTAGYDSMFVEVYKNNILWKRNSVRLVYSGNSAPFLFNPKIHVELSEYKFLVYAKINSTAELVAERDSIVCGDAYLINGQSNSHPTNPGANYRNEFCRSFGKNTNYGSYNPADTLWGLARGDDAVNFHTGVWGIRLQQYIKETYGVPVCIINGGSGGSSIEYNLRNNQNHTDLNTTYGRLLYRAQKAGLSRNIKAMMWHQGESNADLTWMNYNSNFSLLYNEWKEDYPNIGKIYVFQIHQGCTGGNFIYQNQLREVQRKFPELYQDLEVMSTVGIPGHDGCHYNLTGYYRMAQQIFGLIARDFYESTDTTDIKPPDIERVYYYSAARDKIVLEFSQPNTLVWPADTLGSNLHNYFYLDNVYGNVISHSISGNVLTLILSSPSSAVKLTYLPNIYYNGTTVIYEGPWLKNRKGIGALSFFEFRISNVVPVQNEKGIPLQFGLCQNFPNPFNPTTKIKFDVSSNLTLSGAKGLMVKLKIYDLLGRLITTLVNEQLKPGTYEAQWDATNYPSGLYFYRLEAGNYLETKRMVLIK